MPHAATPAPNAAAALLPDGIEIFRPGRHTDDAGRVHSFTEADVADMAASYNPSVREAPLCVGHPQDNLPAYGWVKAMGRTASGALTINAHQVEPQFAEMVRAGRFKKRSASFYPPQSPANPTPGRWYLRHVAFLGAQPPAVPGLKDIAFAAGDAADGAVVCFSEPVVSRPASTTVSTTYRQEGDHTMTEEEMKALKAELAAEKQARIQAEAASAQARSEADAATAQAASFAEKARADRKAGFVSFAQAQVQAGRLLPKDQDMAVATLEALADAQPFEFSEGGTTTKVAPAQWLQDLIAAARPQVSFGEFAGAPQGTAAGAAKGKSDAEIDQAAQAWMRQHKVDYAQALAAVTATFTH